MFVTLNFTQTFGGDVGKTIQKVGFGSHNGLENANLGSCFAGSGKEGGQFGDIEFYLHSSLYVYASERKRIPLSCFRHLLKMYMPQKWPLSPLLIFPTSYTSSHLLSLSFPCRATGTPAPSLGIYLAPASLRREQTPFLPFSKSQL